MPNVAPWSSPATWAAAARPPRPPSGPWALRLRLACGPAPWSAARRGLLVPSRDRPVHARRAEALRRHRPLVRRAGGQGRDARRRANRREADRRDRPPSGAMPPPACRAAMAAGRSPPAMGRSGVQTTPRSTATTQIALHRCRLSAGHRRCGRRRWADVSVDGRAPVGGEITYADCGKVFKTLGSLWFVYTVCIGAPVASRAGVTGRGAAWRWVYGRAVTVCPR